MDQSEKNNQQSFNETNPMNDKDVTANKQEKMDSDQTKDQATMDSDQAEDKPLINEKEQLEDKPVGELKKHKGVSRYISLFLNSHYSSIAFMACGIILVLLSYFYPYLSHLQDKNVLKLKSLADFVDRFESPERIAFIFLLFPNVFSILIIHLTIFVKKMDHIKWLRFPLIIFNWSGLLIIFPIYFGWYFMSPRKEGWDAISGFILIAIMLLTFSFLSKVSRVQLHSSAKTIYLAIRGAFLNIIGFIVVIMILLYGDKTDILDGAYLSIIGSTILFLGLLLYLYYAKTTNKDWFIDIETSREKKRAAIESRAARIEAAKIEAAKAKASQSKSA